MAAPQPDSVFLNRLPLEIRNAIYDVYAVCALDKAAHDNATFKRTKFEYMSNYTQGRTLNKTTRLCPPIVKTCKTIAREFAVVVSKYALIMYETPVNDNGPMLGAIRTVTIGRLRPAVLRHVRVTWKLAVEYIDETPEPELMEECTLKTALQTAVGSSLPNFTTIQYELYDIERRKECEDVFVVRALEPTLDHFLANVVKNHNLETLELTGLFRTCWIDAKQKKHDKLQIRRGQHDDSGGAEDFDTDSMEDYWDEDVEMCKPSY